MTLHPISCLLLLMWLGGGLLATEALWKWHHILLASPSLVYRILLVRSNTLIFTYLFMYGCVWFCDELFNFSDFVILLVVRLCNLICSVTGLVEVVLSDLVRLCYLIGWGCLCVTGPEAAEGGAEGPREVFCVDQVHHCGETTAVLRLHALQVQGTCRFYLRTM